MKYLQSIILWILILMLSLTCILRFGIYSIDYIVQNAIIHIILVLFAIIIVLSLIKLVFTLLPVTSKYKKGGTLADWYDSTLKLNGRDWFIKVYNKLKSETKDKNEIVILSPAANKGIYEKELYKYLNSKGINCKIVSSDISKIENHENSEKNSIGEYLYLLEQIDAQKIVEITNKAEVDEADYLFDIKGCLWYKKDFINILTKYNKVLKDNGRVVIDCEVISILRYVLNLTIYHLSFCKITIGHMENTTYQILNRHIKTSKKLRIFIEQNFNIEIYKDLKIATLKKK